MVAPRRITTHGLNGIKGWPNMHAVDFAAKFYATDLATIQAAGRQVYAGMCVHLDSAGTFRLGVANRQMPMFLFHSADEPDVVNDGGDPATDVGAWVAISPTAVLNALVATGAYELETTAFVDATFLPNETLTAATGTGATAGKLANSGATPYTNAVCGVVSRGKYQNAHRVYVLAFWPVYLPTAGALTD